MNNIFEFVNFKITKTSLIRKIRHDLYSFTVYNIQYMIYSILLEWIKRYLLPEWAEPCSKYIFLYSLLLSSGFGYRCFIIPSRYFLKGHNISFELSFKLGEIQWKNEIFRKFFDKHFYLSVICTSYAFARFTIRVQYTIFSIKFSSIFFGNDLICVKEGAADEMGHTRDRKKSFRFFFELCSLCINILQGLRNRLCQTVFQNSARNTLFRFYFDFGPYYMDHI